MRAAKSFTKNHRQVTTSRNRIRFVGGVCTVLSLALLPVPEVTGQLPSPQEIAKSVVKVEARISAQKANVGTGFVWSAPTYIVTALHVVAGINKITVFAQSPAPNNPSQVIEKSSGAKIVKVHYGADLALLQLDRDLGLAPLRLGTPDLNQDYKIWGFPLDLPHMKSDRVRFSETVLAKPTFQSLIKTEAKFNELVGGDGFPKWGTQILEVSDTILPGHSGAPILDKSGAVVGIGDGGLYEGIKRINWAIPATLYLPDLNKSTDSPPARPSAKAARFSFQTGDGKEIPFAAHNKSAPVASKTSPAPVEDSANMRSIWDEMDTEDDDAQALHLVWSAPLSEIIATADPDDVDDFKKWSLAINKETGFSLAKAIIEVYEDYQTGATIAVPQGLTVYFDPEDRMLEISTPNEKVQMIVQVVENASAAEAQAARDYFDDYLATFAKWQQDPKEDDEVDGDRAAEYWSLAKSRLAVDENGENSGEMYATLTIAENYFLGTAVILLDYDALSDEDWNYYYLMMECVDLSGFAIE